MPEILGLNRSQIANYFGWTQKVDNRFACKENDQ